MSKKLKVFKFLSNAILLICAVIFAYYVVDVTIGILNDPSNGWGAVGLLIFFIYAIPVTLYCLVYGIIMLAKKRYKWYDLVIGLFYLISYASLILAPLLIA